MTESRNVINIFITVEMYEKDMMYIFSFFCKADVGDYEIVGDFEH